MRRLISLTTAAALLISTAARADVDEALDQVLLPGYAGFAGAARALDAAAQADCAPGALKAPWNAAYDAWLRVGHIRIGPGEEGAQASAILYWPDPRGSLQKAQDAALEAGVGSLEDAPHAARGLMALERLIYDPPAANAAAICDLTRATTFDLARMASAIEAGWTGGFAERLRHPGAAGNSRYLNQTEARQALFMEMVGGFDFLVKQRLGRPLGTFDHPHPERAEARASNRSVENVALQLRALRDLALALKPDIPLTEAALARAIGLADGLNDPVFDGVADPSGRLKVEILQQAAHAARDTAINEIGPSLGVDMSFNASDGD